MQILSIIIKRINTICTNNEKLYTGKKQKDPSIKHLATRSVWYCCEMDQL
jgi:hypothetical protein